MKHSVHMNYINIPLMLPSLKSEGLIKVVEGPSSITELIAMKAQEVAEAARELDTPYLLMLNHPFWVYYDIAPRHLIDCPQIRFFEICNFGSDHAPHPDALTYTVDKFWDIVHAPG